MLIETPPSLPALTLSARVTYAEDGFSRISSPLQGPVLDVRVKLGQAVKAGDILMVIDAADIATAYAAYVEEISEPSYQAFLPKADALVIRTQPLSAASIAKAPGLRIVSRHGVGFDAVDVAALNARGVPLCIVGDVNSSGVAEHAMMLILAATHRLIAADKATRSGDWGWRNGLQTHEVAGKRLLIVGFGRIEGRTIGVVGV